MSCNTCLKIRQYVINQLLSFDHVINSLLLGDPNETLSQRTARAARYGKKLAKVICWCLNIINKNHCEWSLQPGPSIGKEIFAWSPPVNKE